MGKIIIDGREAGILAEALENWMFRYEEEQTFPQAERLWAIQEKLAALDHSEELSADKREIITCEHCARWKNGHVCEPLSRFGTFETRKDFFCGYGERRQEDAE